MTVAAVMDDNVIASVEVIEYPMNVVNVTFVVIWMVVVAENALNEDVVTSVRQVLPANVENFIEFWFFFFLQFQVWNDLRFYLIF